VHVIICYIYMVVVHEGEYFLAIYYMHGNYWIVRYGNSKSMIAIDLHAEADYTIFPVILLFTLFCFLL